MPSRRQFYGTLALIGFFLALPIFLESLIWVGTGSFNLETVIGFYVFLAEAAPRLAVVVAGLTGLMIPMSAFAMWLSSDTTTGSEG